MNKWREAPFVSNIKCGSTYEIPSAALIGFTDFEEGSKSEIFRNAT